VEQLRGISDARAGFARLSLKALQAQINPHFFFNALNTLYGNHRPRQRRCQATGAESIGRVPVSVAIGSCSDRIGEELRIVRAYLEIEQLRLGAKAAGRNQRG